MFKIIVMVLAALNMVLFAPAIIATAISNPTPESFSMSFALAGFLIMTAALLVWATHNLPERAPVLFWNGMVRIFASSATAYAISINLEDVARYAFVAFDMTAGMILIMGAIKTSQRSLWELLLWRVR
ncbi:MAG: hypothetical protein JXQ85_08565 [Cognatishimia sp.]|uniref:hypothetical protein n=1 Tax=Cognatishimia sp. TaxID=2211648 RepID=UPI003B8CC3E6